MNKIHKILSKLFYEHDCIIIPGFGGFILNYQNTKFDKKTNTFYPPRKTISFNKRLNKNDGILINSLKDSEKISYKDARKIINDFTKNINKKLDKFQEYKFEEIGIIKLDNYDKLIFQEFEKINFLNDSFGFQKFKFYPLETKTHRTLKEQDFQNYKYLIRAAAVMLPLILIASLAIIQQNNIITTIQKVSKSNFLDISLNNEEIIKYNYNINKNINNNLLYLYTNEISEVINETNIKINNINKTNLPTIQKSQKEKEYKFYIINGSFSNKKYAVRLKNELTKQGFNSFIMKKDKKNRYKVCSFATNKKEKAVYNLSQIKKLHHKAWLLKI